MSLRTDPGLLAVYGLTAAAIIALIWWTPSRRSPAADLRPGDRFRLARGGALLTVDRVLTGPGECSVIVHFHLTRPADDGTHPDADRPAARMRGWCTFRPDTTVHDLDPTGRPATAPVGAPA